MTTHYVAATRHLEHARRASLDDGHAQLEALLGIGHGILALVALLEAGRAER